MRCIYQGRATLNNLCLYKPVNTKQLKKNFSSLIYEIRIALFTSYVDRQSLIYMYILCLIKINIRQQLLINSK
jgi:hypothetical protein